ncbi:MAG: hypothetical protein QOF36_288, partial [Microbacteriaceae bacterium]|nr:hypothetical protein [Microbacteriaceae bacterium]
MTETVTRQDRGRPVTPSKGSLRPLGIDEVTITGGFWGEKQAL